ncbi:hypothetical protein C4568_01625 [Candidatus Parcubacteria bacterium]|nr:MAG: hypothetical protein C4568_01625 [Candidatus Parcubacteria bacterium]
MGTAVQQVVALVDTGFTGELKISEQHMQELGLKQTHVETVSLADDSNVEMPASIAYVAMDNVVNLVNVLVAPGGVIVGAGLMRKFGHTLTINFPLNSMTLIA